MKSFFFGVAGMILSGCGQPEAAGAPQEKAVVLAPTSPLVVDTALSAELACLDGIDVRTALKAPGGTQDLRDRCLGEVSALTEGWELSSLEMDAVILTFVAYRSAPYASSRAVTREALMADPGLDCDNYVLLVEYLLRDIHPDARLIFAGFDGGAIGNHVQAFVSGGDVSVLLDPTVGVVARTGFNPLLKGVPVAGGRMLQDARAPEAAVASLHERVLASLAEGKNQPSDMLYYLRGVESMVAFSDHAGEFWTPDQYPLLLLHYPTPGADGLRKNLVPDSP